MIFYSQKDPRWANEKLGTCPDTIAKSGCKITSLASFCGKTPSEVNRIIPYVSGCLTNDETAAKALGLEFKGKSYWEPYHDCIAETDHYKSKGVPQHFFILLADGRCVDPLDLNPAPKKNPYKIVSYRLFKPLITEEPMQKEFVEAVEKLLGEEYGDNLNDSEQKDAAKKLKEVKGVIETLRQNNKDDLATIQEMKEKLEWCNQLELTNKRLLENNEIIANKLAEEKLKYIGSVASVEEMKKTVREYTDKAGLCEPALATCQENLRVQSEKAEEGIKVYSALELIMQSIKKMWSK